jgi:hypothetical protein
MRAKAVTQGGPAPRLRAWAPASARATEKEEFGTICLVQTTSGDLWELCLAGYDEIEGVSVEGVSAAHDATA